MKILLITPYYYPNIVGGAEISMQLLAEGLTRLSHDVKVLTMSYKNEKKVLNGVTIIGISNNSLNSVWKKTLKKEAICKDESHMLQFTPWLPFLNDSLLYKNILSEVNPDVIVINSNEEWFGRASLWKELLNSKKKVILTLRDPILLSDYFFKIDVSWIYRKIINKACQKFLGIVSPSQYMLKLYNENGIKHDNQTVIYNAVDCISEFEVNKQRRILYAGSLEEKKGIYTLVKAYNQLIYEHYDVELIFVGKGSCASMLNEQGYTVIDWMDRNALYEYMKKSWIVVLPSEWEEAFGRIVIESVFNGTLAIGSNAGGIPEIFADNIQYVFEQKNYSQLKSIIEWILSMNINEYHTEIRRLQTDWERFTLDYHIKKWSDYLNEQVEK